jgi:hypothetical protein
MPVLKRDKDLINLLAYSFKGPNLSGIWQEKNTKKSKHDLPYF